MSETVNATVSANLADVKSKIAAAAEDAGRDPNDISLIAVSKVQPLERVEAALIAGHRVFGENRVQEAAGKWPDFKDKYDGIELRLIGPLQTNKVKDAVALFDVIESVDRPKLAAALAKEMEKQGRTIPCFIQVNTGEEPQKAGIMPSDADAFIKQCRDDLGLQVRGLMCIPPADQEPAPHFALLKKIADRNGLSQLSMGMSGDFEIAVTFGVTSVRVGTAIFGDRDYPAA